jgi:hypothetical protein
MNNLSLLSIMREDPEFGKRISKKVQEIKQDKEHLLSAADEYGAKYQEEILEGTRKRALLLKEGSSRGLSENEVMQEYGKFVPTVYTPILNFLYFMLRESEPQDRNNYRRRDMLNEQLIRLKQLNHDEGEQDLSDAQIVAILDDKLKQFHVDTVAEGKRTHLNKQFSDEETLPEDEVKLKEPQEMVEYLYGHITLDMFNKIKKLKALSKSPNESEAFQAYRKALELCKEYNLEFDRIPCYVGDKKTVK